MSAEEALKRIDDARDFLSLGQRGSEPYLGPALEIALAALREKQERENPEPLTLEQLYGMRGEPVWCVDGSGNSGWYLVSCQSPPTCIDEYEKLEGKHFELNGDCEHGLHAFGWLAYAHKPMEVPHAET